MLRDSPFSYQLIWQDDSKVGLSYIHILAPFLKSQFAVMPPPPPPFFFLWADFSISKPNVQ